MKRIKAADVVLALFSSTVETFVCLVLTKMFVGSFSISLCICVLLVLFVWNLLLPFTDKPKEIPKVGYVIVNVDDPDKELLAIKLLVGEADLINKEEIAFDVVKES